jgi:hypothetical protein
MIEDTAAKKTSYEARMKLTELRNVMYDYPTNVDQSCYNLVMHLLDALQTAIRLAGEVKE